MSPAARSVDRKPRRLAKEPPNPRLIRGKATLDYAQSFPEGIVDVQVRRVQMHRVGRGAHGRVGAFGVAGVALDDVGENHGIIDALAALGQFESPALRARAQSRSRKF